MEWREINNGWAVKLAEGVTGSIQLTRKGVRWNLMLGGNCETVVEAQEKLEALVGKLGIELADAADTGAAVISGD